MCRIEKVEFTRNSSSFKVVNEFDDGLLLVTIEDGSKVANVYPITGYQNKDAVICRPIATFAVGNKDDHSYERFAKLIEIFETATLAEENKGTNYPEYIVKNAVLGELGRVFITTGYSSYRRFRVNNCEDRTDSYNGEIVKDIHEMNGRLFIGIKDCTPENGSSYVRVIVL